MKTYTVHEHPEPPADRLDRAGRLVFIRDGFSWSAGLLTPFWAIAHRLWFVLLGYIATLIVMSIGFYALDLSQTVSTITILALQLAIAFEAASLRRWELRFRGWQFLGSVNGRTREDCERRFFALWLPSQPLIRVETLSGSRFLGGASFGASTERLRRRFTGFGRGSSGLTR